MKRTGGIYIEGFENKYKIYENGDVENCSKGTLLKQITHSGTAKYVHPSFKGKRYQLTVHALVNKYFNTTEIFPIKYKNVGNFYGIDKDGNIWSYYMNRKFTPHVGKFGYLQVLLYVDNKYINYKVHRLMGYTFMDMKYNSINHINGNKLDNRLVNLENVPIQYNIKHAHQFKKNKTSEYIGVDKTPNGRFRASLQISNKANYLGTFDSETDAALAYNEASIRLLEPEFRYLNILN
jgi:hypothetical protein